MRRVLLFIGTIALLVIATFAGWDFLQLGREVPPMLPSSERATLIVVEKHARRIAILRNGKSLAIYAMSLGGHPVGHKQQEGDGRTPEGRYTIDSKNSRSHFHLALHISYPDAADREHARQLGVSPGGDIMIHGLPNGLGWLGRAQLSFDWTDGCIAVTNPQIEEIWAMVDAGTPVEIKP